MLSVTHTLISLPVAIYIQNPVLVFIISFLLHFLADTLLHWNIYPSDFKRYPVGLVALDIIGGIVISWVLVGASLWTIPVLLAIAGGNAPDVIQTLWEMLSTKLRLRLRILTPFFEWHDHLQHETTNIVHGLALQAIMITLAIILTRMA